MAIWSAVKKSELKGALRIDAEYYKPDYLQAEKKIKAVRHDRLGNLISVLTDYHANGSYEVLRNNVELLDKPDYALMIRTVDFENDDFINDVKYISKHSYDFLKKTKLFGNEIIINKIGNPGKVYIVPPLKRKISLGMNQFMLRVNKKINGNYLYVFLVSSIGRKLLKRKITGAVPLSIDKESVRSVIIPKLDDDFQLQIDGLVEDYFKLNIESKSLYSRAEKILLNGLGIKDLDLKDDLFYKTTLKEAISVNRMDAEFFMPKYEKLMKHIMDFSPKKLGAMAKFKKGTEPGSSKYTESGKPFIRVSNLSKFGITTNNQKYLEESLYLKLRKFYEPKKGEILLSKDATPGIACVLKNDIVGIISGGILRLKFDDDVKKEYIALVINSQIGQMQAKRDAGGAVINHWKPEQIGYMKIPMLEKGIQYKIEQFCLDSFLKREQAKKLLDEAKCKVEDMIEKETGVR